MILNLTQHNATPDQIESGVVELPSQKKKLLTNLLTVNDLPTKTEIQDRCASIAFLAIHNGLGDDGDDVIITEVMIGGAPAMMRPLEDALLGLRIQPLYAFSKRESVESIQTDGSVRKENVFRNVGWWPRLNTY